MEPNMLSVLTAEECEDLSEAALTVIEEIGILVTLPEAIDLLVGAGATKGDGGRIRMDRRIVRKLVAQAPSTFKFHDRAGGSIDIGAGHRWTINGGTVSRVVEWPGWSQRPATREDVGKLGSLCDALPLVHAVVPMVEPQDVESARAEVVSFLETVVSTTKFVMVCPLVHSSAKAWVEMGRIVCGTDDLSKAPSVGVLVTILPSLHLDDECAATTILGAREGLPLVSMGGAMAGSSGPNTIASAALLKLAGVLFIAMLAQIARAGAPVLLDCGVVALDMNTTDIGEAGPEYPLGAVALAQASREFGLPTYSCALHCEAKIGDVQAGLEKMAGMMSALLGGVDVTTNMGMLSRCSAASYEQLLVDHELCAFLERFGRGVMADDDTLALEVIREVGLGGDFITHEHTLKHCRSGEIWYPTLLDRSATGNEAVDLYEKAHGQVQEMLESHTPDVDPGIRKDLESFVSKLG